MKSNKCNWMMNHHQFALRASGQDTQFVTHLTNNQMIGILRIRKRQTIRRGKMMTIEIDWNIASRQFNAHQNRRRWRLKLAMRYILTELLRCNQTADLFIKSRLYYRFLQLPWVCEWFICLHVNVHFTH